MGFIFEPIGVIGYGTGIDKKGFEAGAGVSFIKYWKWRLDNFLTNKGIYIGTHYQITDNSGLGLALILIIVFLLLIVLFFGWRFWNKDYTLGLDLEWWY